MCPVSACSAKRLRLVITSATLDGEKFSAYFGDCPVFDVPGRTYPVEVIHSLDNHTSDYLLAAVETAMSIHADMPPGTHRQCFCLQTHVSSLLPYGLMATWHAVLHRC